MLDQTAFMVQFDRPRQVRMTLAGLNRFQALTGSDPFDLFRADAMGPAHAAHKFHGRYFPISRARYTKGGDFRQLIQSTNEEQTTQKNRAASRHVHTHHA